MGLPANIVMELPANKMSSSANHSRAIKLERPCSVRGERERERGSIARIATGYAANKALLVAGSGGFSRRPMIRKIENSNNF
jgi:hypothetical protein